MTTKRQILENLPLEISKILENILESTFEKMQEIRLRMGRQLMLCVDGDIKTLPHIVTREEIEKCLQIISGCSVYAFLEEIKNGFITINGGHRIGICGRAVVQNGVVTNIKSISGINIRIAHQIKGCANKIMPYILDKGIGNTLIISPPQCGKTTIIRDVARQLGERFKVSVIDERGEICAMSAGEPQYDIGEMTDVIDLCPKSIGIELMLRSMSPEVIITDEIADCDISSLKRALSCGVKIIATAHGDNIENTLKRLKTEDLINEFSSVILLSNRKGAGTIEEVKHYGYKTNRQRNCSVSNY